MSKFTQADSSVHEMASELIRRYHPELLAVERFAKLEGSGGSVMISGGGHQVTIPGK